MSVFNALNLIWGPLDVDLFVSRLTFQLEKYFSWTPDPGAHAVNAFLQCWSDLRGYAFSPFAMIQRVLQKVRQDQRSLILITHFWPSQAWFPTTLELASSSPFLIPAVKGLLTNAEGEDHHLILSGNLNLLAWKVSGNPTNCLAFRDQLQLSSDNLGRQDNTIGTTTFGKNGFVGAWKGTWIPWRLLSYT